MNFSKNLGPIISLLLLASLGIGGCRFFAGRGGSSTQIAQVTPISVTAEATLSFISPAVVRATPAPDEPALSTMNSPLDIQAAAADQVNNVSNIPTPHGIPTPQPASEDMERGKALDQMQEIDRAWEVAAPDPKTLDDARQAELAEDVVLLYLDEFFNNDFDPFTGTPPTMTEKLLSLDGRQVEVRGYMAPPLKLGLDWFLLGELPVGVCPFHANVGSITAGSALVYVDGPEYPFSGDPLSVVGEMHIGELADPETGMVSIARLYTTKDEINVLTLPRR